MIYFRKSHISTIQLLIGKKKLHKKKNGKSYVVSDWFVDINSLSDSF
jgi:hypothetical protein